MIALVSSPLVDKSDITSPIGSYEKPFDRLIHRCASLFFAYFRPLSPLLRFKNKNHPSLELLERLVFLSLWFLAISFDPRNHGTVDVARRNRSYLMLHNKTEKHKENRHNE